MWNLNLFPTIVWTARIRDASNSWVFFDLDCSVNISASLDTSEKVELNCGNWDSVVLEKPAASITLWIVKTKNPDLIWKLYDLAVTSATSWAKTITNELMTFDSNDKIEIQQRSTSDALWVTSLVVKSADGSITYTVSTHYTIATVDWKTTITRVWVGTIPAWATVSISWSYNTNAYKEVSISRVQRAKKQFTLEVYGQDQTTLKYTTLLASPVTLDTSFLIEMKDQFRDWQANGAELTFNLLDMWNLKFRDENI